MLAKSMIVLLIVTMSFVAITGYIGNSYGIAKKVHERVMIDLAKSHAAFYILHSEKVELADIASNVNGMTQEMLNSFGDDSWKYSATVTTTGNATSVDVKNYVVYIHYGTYDHSEEESCQVDDPEATYTQYVTKYTGSNQSN